MDVSERINYLLTVEKGWNDGYGEPVDKNLAAFLEAGFKEYYPDNYPFPYMSPTEDGGISIEFDQDDVMVAVEIEPDKQVADTYTLNKYENFPYHNGKLKRDETFWKALLELVRYVYNIPDSGSQ